MNYFADIDWLTCVFPDGASLGTVVGTKPYMLWRERVGGYGYNRGHVDDVSGLVRLHSTNRVNMGVCYIASASVLSALAELHGSSSYLFGAQQMGFELARATRLDVRVDVQDDGKATYLLANQMAEGLVKCKAKRLYQYRGVNGTSGLTCYFGSKSSESYVRVYDKFAESNGTKPYTRVECQLRGIRASKAWDALSVKVDDTINSSTIRSIVRSHIECFSVPELDEIINSNEPFSFKVDNDKSSDIRRWLERQVLPTFLRDTVDHEGNAPLLDWFIKRVRDRYTGE